MRVYEETIRHWQLTADEERAVIAAIRGYLDSVPTDEFTSATLLGLLHAATQMEQPRYPVTLGGSIPALPQVSVGPLWASRGDLSATRPPEFDMICARPDCFSNAPHDHGDGTGIFKKPEPTPSALTSEQQQALAAEAAKIDAWGGVKLATHEGADK